MSSTRRRFSQEFKDELRREVSDSSRPVKTVAAEYGVGGETLRTWLTKYREEHGGTRAEPLRACPAQGSGAWEPGAEGGGTFLKSGRILRTGAAVVAKYEFMTPTPRRPRRRPRSPRRC